MGDVKPWQVILIVVAVLALGISVWKFAFSGGVDLPDSVTVVDVSTGQLFELDISGRKAAAYPEKNPDTDSYTLMPVVKAEDGQWYIVQRLIPVLDSVESGLDAVQDASSGLVKISTDRPRRIGL